MHRRLAECTVVSPNAGQGAFGETTVLPPDASILPANFVPGERSNIFHFHSSVHMSFTDPATWFVLLQIIGVNIVLSVDNAVVIALAARSLPAAQQRQAVLWGSGAAVVMRVLLTI